MKSSLMSRSTSITFAAVILLAFTTSVLAAHEGRMNHVRAYGRLGMPAAAGVKEAPAAGGNGKGITRRSAHGSKRAHGGHRHVRRYTPKPATGERLFHLPLYPVAGASGAARNYDKHLLHARTRHDRVVSLRQADDLVKRAIDPTNAASNGTDAAAGVVIEAKAAAGAVAGTAKAAAGKAESDGVSAKEIKAAADNLITAPSGTASKNSIGLSIEADDVGYFAKVTVGTPGTVFNILMDSGSADFWVPSEACSQAQCGAHTRLGPKASSTFQASTTAFEVSYGTGDVAGTLAKDTINIAGLKLLKHTFGVTTQESVDFGAGTVPFDALMGLAKSTLSNEKVPTPIEALKAAGLVKAAQMGYALGRVADDTNIGQVTFGGVDATRFTGSLTLVDNVSKLGFWEAAMDAVAVNGKSLNLPGRTAILDTGTTLIVAPLADATAIHAAIPGSKTDGQGTFTVPCTTTASVSLSFGGQTFSIEPSDLAFLPVNANNPTGDCQSGISAGQIGGAREWLVGDVFLKNVYLSTNVDTDQIGLAPVIAG